jgi:molecular chaperone DnaK
MTPKLAVGIDLGTTYSVASWVDGTGRTAVIANSEGDLLTPSVVTFADDGILVGKEAKKHGVLEPDRFAELAKRDMGSPFYSRPIDGQYLPPEVIQACILRKLGQDVTTRIGPDFGVVITVPAFFDEPRRRATAIAGEIAGLHVLDIINEPVAVALAFGEHIGMLRAGAPHIEPQRVMVYDLGGGTFDATLLEINQIGFRTLATDGEVHLGGRDWDLSLADLVCEKFKRQYREDPRENPVSKLRLMAEVEHAKHTLTARQRSQVRFDHAGSVLEAQISREEFEERTAELLERTAHTTRQLLAAKGHVWSDVSTILLAGGSTRMPMVGRMLKEESGIEPSAVVSPDEAVARGAAIYARYLLKQASDLPPRFEITNVSSHNLGIQGVELDTGEKVNAVLIPRNTPLPATATHTFVTRRSNQRNIAVLILEGEGSMPSECTVIGRSVVKDLPANLPAGYPIEITYEYATNGRLHVHASVPDTGRELDIEIDRGARLPDEWISEWRNVVSNDSPWSKYKSLLAQQRKRGNSAWRELSVRTSSDHKSDSSKVDVEYDQVVLPPGEIAQDGLTMLSQRQFELDRTIETVGGREADKGNKSDARTRTAGLEAIYAPHRGKSARRKKRLREQRLTFILCALSGPVGLFLGQMVLWWCFHCDPFKIGPLVPARFNWVVPPRIRAPLHVDPAVVRPQPAIMPKPFAVPLMVRRERIATRALVDPLQHDDHEPDKDDKRLVVQLQPRFQLR